MSILRSALKSLGQAGLPVPRSQSVVYNSPWWDESDTITGKAMNVKRAFGYAPFFAGVRLIAESVARLPLITYRRKGDDDRERLRSTQLYRMLRHEPNPYMSAMVWRSAMQGHLVTWGNCYSERVRDDLGRDAQLFPLRPDRMQVLMDSDTGRKFYRYRVESLGDEIDLTADQVFHIPGFGSDGLVGYSVVSLWREALALGLSAQEFGSRFFKSGAQPAAVVTVPAAWSDETKTTFGNKLRANTAGLTNAQRIAILEEGVSWQQVGMNLDDAQFLETRKYQRGETATMLNVPPHMIGDVERSTSWGTGIEEQTLGFVTYNLGNWLELWQQETDRQIVRPAYGDDVYAEFLVDALLKGRAEDRWKSWRQARELGIVNGDYIARKENIPVPEDGSGRFYWRPIANYELFDPDAEEEEPPQLGNGAGALPPPSELAELIPSG